MKPDIIQLGFLDFDSRLHRIDKAGDPLTKINETIDWELFCQTLERARMNQKTNSGANKSFDVVLLFKILILQSLYNLSNELMEFQILDRDFFSRFLGFHAASMVPDATTIWRFREDLANSGTIATLFSQFDQFLHDHGFRVQKGQIIDASIVRVPVQRNKREENKQIKDREQPEVWCTNKQRQKEINSRWTKKNGKSVYGYRNHISDEAKHKLIWNFSVTSAKVHDSRVFFELLDYGNTSHDVWADSAYHSQGHIEDLQKTGYREHLQRKGSRNRKFTVW